ncbi:hypothetical protein ACIBL8_48165 [Streptomyces sp. NPDC050523]|uniref:hypothetical protein n=1 Tax=Streptomyces sp. NPDC050523 TaxID=3365622 RepID=UPI00378EC25A
MRDHLDLGELLRQRRVDLSALDPAPAEPTDREHFDRIHRMLPCSLLCERKSSSVRMLDDPEHGPRWVDLCFEHALMAPPPQFQRPITWKGILTDLQEAADKVGLTLTVRSFSDGELKLTAYRARERRERP